MAVKLGVGGVVNLLDVAAQLGQITHRAEPNVQQQQQTGLMPGHLTHLTTDPGAHLVFEDAVARGAFSKKCNLTREIELINAGFGKWLAKEGYPLPPRTAEVPRALPPPPPPVDEKGRKRGASAAAAEPAKAEVGDDGAALAELQTQYMLQNRLAWRNEELSNWRAAASRPTPQPTPEPEPHPRPRPPSLPRPHPHPTGPHQVRRHAARGGLAHVASRHRGAGCRGGRGAAVPAALELVDDARQVGRVGVLGARRQAGRPCAAHTGAPAPTAEAAGPAPADEVERECARWRRGQGAVAGADGPPESQAQAQTQAQPPTPTPTRSPPSLITAERGAGGQREGGAAR